MLKERGSLLALALIIVLTLSGCSTQWYIGIRYADGESLQFFVPLCDDQRLERLWLDDLEGEILWELRATGDGAPLAAIEFGAEPPGFEGEGIISLAQLEALDDRRLRINAQTSAVSQMIGVFELSALPTDGSVTWFEDGRDRVLSANALENEFRDECSSKSSPMHRLVSGAVLLVVIGVAITGLLVWRRRPADA